ncbi:putative integral membrane protein [Brugia pahangi]
MAKFVRIRHCYHPKYYYARQSNKLFYLCYNDNSITNETLFVDEGLKLKLRRYGYKDITSGLISLSNLAVIDYLGQIITLNDVDDQYPKWFLSLTKEDALKSESERMLICIVGSKIRYMLQTTIAQFCIFEILTLSFRMTVHLLPNDFNKTEFMETLEFNDSQIFPSVEHKRLPVNALALIITRQESMIETRQISGNITDTLDMDTFITIILAMPLYIFLIIIISIPLIRWRIIIFAVS